jgi:nicotinic acid mononucleotide adenylyltransferase
VIGSDHANEETIRSWEQGDWLFEVAPWLIVTRPGHPLVSPPKNHTVLELDLNGAGTDIVSAIRAGTEGWEKLVANEVVADYIKEHELYGYRSQ